MNLDGCTLETLRAIRHQILVQQDSVSGRLKELEEKRDEKIGGTRSEWKTALEIYFLNRDILLAENVKLSNALLDIADAIRKMNGEN